jgi:hypothetical protein
MHIPHPYRPYHPIPCALCMAHTSPSVHSIPCVPCTCNLSHTIPCTLRSTHTGPIDLDKSTESPFPGPIDPNQIVIYGHSLAQIIKDAQEDSARETMERVANKMEEILPGSEIGKIIATLYTDTYFRALQGVYTQMNRNKGPKRSRTVDVCHIGGRYNHPSIHSLYVLNTFQYISRFCAN